MYLIYIKAYCINYNRGVRKHLHHCVYAKRKQTVYLQIINEDLCIGRRCYLSNIHKYLLSLLSAQRYTNDTYLSSDELSLSGFPVFNVTQQT